MGVLPSGNILMKFRYCDVNVFFLPKIATTITFWPHSSVSSDLLCTLKARGLWLLKKANSSMPESAAAQAEILYCVQTSERF